MNMILLLDNHDSFTWNLVELLRSIGKGNLKIVPPETLDTSSISGFDRILFSPGPGLPGEQPAMFSILENLPPGLPVLGVCLGMQAIAEFYGARLINLPAVVHGQTRELRYTAHRSPLFNGIPEGSPVGLYHSWAVDPASVPPCLKVTAVSDEGTIMAMEHASLPVCGVQFHPESAMTPLGARIMENWVKQPF